MIRRAFRSARPRLVSALCAAMVASASCARSPASDDRCEQAIATVQSRRLASPQDERAWSALPGCGTAAGLAARDVWTSLRSVSDTAQLANTFGRLRSFRDASLLAAASTVLLDSAATATARVYSAMLAVAQVRPLAEPEYRFFATTGPHDPCVAPSAWDRPTRHGTPLPADASEQVKAAALRVMTDQSAPQPVRNAARCTYDTVTGESTTFASARAAPVTTAHVRESAGRLDAEPALASRTTPRTPSRASRVRATGDSIRARIALAKARGCVTQQPHDSFFVRARQETRVHDGILRRGPHGDVLETRDGQRLPVANLPAALQKADGMRVWIGEPLGAPKLAGVVDPAFRGDCPE